MNSKKFFFYFLFFLFLVVFCKFTYAFSIGVSPTELELSTNSGLLSDNKLVLFNPNNYSLNFEIISCNYNPIDFENNGTINSFSYKTIYIDVNKNLSLDNLPNLSNCNIDIAFSKNNYKTALSVELVFVNNSDKNEFDYNDTNNIITGNFWKDDILEENNVVSETVDYKFIIVASVVFIIILIAVILYK